MSSLEFYQRASITAGIEFEFYLSPYFTVADYFTVAFEHFMDE